MGKISNSELLTYSTVRIECELNNKFISYGTGFFFAFEKTEEAIGKLVILTNKHVIKDSVNLTISLTAVDKNTGMPIDGKIITANLDIKESNWVAHPSNDVDLCALKFDDLHTQITDKYGEFFFFPMNKTLLPTQQIIEDLRAMEELIMIGYPNTLWDNVNNKPIVRKGMTAVHPKFDYQGKKDIIIDAPCFMGSSGSPVMIFNEGGYTTKTGDLNMQTRIWLLGVLYSGPQYTAEGEIIIKPIVTTPNLTTSTNIPMNLGHVLKAERILDLETLI